MTPDTAPAELSIPDVPRSDVDRRPRSRVPCTAHVYHDVVAAHREAGYEMLADLTAVDYLGHPGRRLPDGVEPERFELVVMLLSLDSGEVPHARACASGCRFPRTTPR